MGKVYPELTREHPPRSISRCSALRSGAYSVFGRDRGWTTDVTVAPPGYGTLDLRTLEDQPGAQAVATAFESPGFDPTTVTRLEVFLSSSGAVDNLSLCIPIPRYGSRPVSRPSAPLRFVPMPSGIVGGWINH